MQVVGKQAQDSNQTASGEEIIPGALYVVATPIGNLEDITYRAVKIIAAVDLVVAEDTRHTRKLLDRYGISNGMSSYHEHNARKVLPTLLNSLESGKSIALVSDAGTPGVSDPGYRLIHEAVELGIRVIPIPGASALLASVVASGLPIDRFTFEGFLPRKKGRKTRLEELLTETRTMVFYESPFRLAATLRDMAEAWGEERKAVVGRELTKKFEELVHGTLGTLRELYEEKQVKGEIAIVVAGCEKVKKTRRSMGSGERK